jgi:hypothetical protein
MNSIRIQKLEGKNIVGMITIPTLQGIDKHVYIWRKKVGNGFFYVSKERQGAEAVFKDFEAVQRNYAAMRAPGIDESLIYEGLDQ